MTEGKIINVHPDLVGFTTNNKTKKRREPKEKKKIKLKEETERKQTLKRNLLKIIRKHQQNKYNEMDKIDNVNTSPAPLTTDGKFQSDFDESLNYFLKLSKEKDNERKQQEMQKHNTTLKNYDNQSVKNPELVESVSNILPEDFNTPYNSLPLHNGKINIPPPPPYGVLKNGTLPTLRTYTRRNLLNNSQTNETNINTNTNNNIVSNDIINDQSSKIKNEESLVGLKRDQSELQNDIHMFKEIKDKLQKEKTYYGIKNKKQKKIMRKTFKIGKRNNTISVLVSNRTIRNNINNKKQEIRQTPISEIKRYLIKKGFIRIGTVAPNHLLRKMYESTMLICGEIENHNIDNLLYNYLNEK